MGKTACNRRPCHRIPPTCRERYLDLRHAGMGAVRDAGVNFAGASRLRRGYRIATGEPLSSHMLIITRAGKGGLRTDTQTVELLPGQSLLVSSGIRCEYYVHRDRWEIAWLYLSDLPRWSHLREKGVVTFANRHAESVCLLMDLLLHELGDGTPGGSPPIVSLVDLLIASLLRLLGENLGKTQGNDAERKSLEQLWLRVRAHPAENWSLHRLASESSLSVSNLQRRVRRCCPKPAHAMVRDIRMDLARMLLLDSNYPLKLIADRIGYADEFIFSAAFRHAHGLSPSAWRRQSRSGPAPNGI